MSEIVFPSTKAGNEVDRAVTAALSTIPGQITQIDTRVTALEEDVDDLSGLPAQVTQIGSKLGDLTELETSAKTSAVAAINEVNSEVGQLDKKVDERVAKLDVNIKEIPVIDNRDNELNVSDKDGNVIAKVNLNGLATNAVLARCFSDLDNSTELNVCDELGNVIFKINQKGITSPSSSARLNYDLGDDKELFICDDLGNVVFKIDSNGNVDYPGIVRMSDIPSPVSSQKIESDNFFPCDINMVITHGQSNSMNGDRNSVANLDFKNSLTFASGTMSLAGGSYDDKTDEELNTLLGGGFADMADYSGNLFSIGGNIAENISTIEDENGIADYDLFGNQYIGVSTGQVKNIQQLTDPNDVYYNRIITAVRFAKKYADDEGKSFCLMSLTYIEGEANFSTAKKLFYDYLWVFFSNIAHDVMAITGQEFVPCFMTYQFGSDYYLSSSNASHIISSGANEALVQIAIDNGDGTGYTLESAPAAYLKNGVSLINRDNIHLSCPFYMLDSQERDTRETMHLNWDEGCYNIFGAYQGLQAKRSVIDGHSIGVLRPISHTIKQASNGKYVVTLEFDVPIPPLQIKPYDSNFGNKVNDVEYEDNFGFTMSAVSHSWDYSDIIESVQVKRMKYVEIVTSSNPTGMYLNYAQKGWLGGGNLCDSQGNACQFTTRGKTFSLDNWCPQFEYHLN